MRPRLFAALLLPLAASCGDPLAPLPADGPPRELTYAVDAGLAGIVSELRVAGDTVVFTSHPLGPRGGATSETRRVPAAAEWRAFWRAARAAGVRGWPRACSEGREVDAGGFTYTLAWDGERLDGSYYGLAPTAGGRCSRADRADASAFAVAVASLAGGSLDAVD